jgi:phage repressor protein C with HTH and peptisase S24 domain
MTQIHEGEALQNAARMSKAGVHGLADLMGIPRSTLYYNFKKERLDYDFKNKAAEVLGIGAEQLFGGVYNNPSDYYTAMPGSRITGDDLRRAKAFGDGGRPPGIGVVPIMAQAGYSKHYLDPKFTDELEEIQLPNLPYHGERYRVFEVSGDSMQPTLKEHFHVVAEKVEPEFWNTTAQFYIYVVVTDDRIMVKRLFRKEDGTFVLISDNEEFYPQFTMKQEEIKEIWLVKRKIDWEMPPPKRFEITV